MMDASQKQDLRFSRLLKLPMYLWSIVFVFVALLYVIGLSFLSRGEIMGVTGEVTLSNYARLASPDYVKVLLQSLKLAALTTAICIVVGYPFGYLMARLSPVARSVVMLLIIVPFWTNALIRIYGWRILLMGNGPINTLLMNLGLIQEPLKLLYTDGAVLLGMVYALIPFMILPTFTTVDKLDFSVVEAARDLGASPLHAFFTVTVPLTLPGLMAGCVLVFIPSMGLFFLNDLLGGSKSVLAGGLIQHYLADYILIILLLGGGVIFTIRLGFIQIRGFKAGWKRTFGGLFSKKGTAGKDGMSSFQALATAIAAQVGTGNIAGAATALANLPILKESFAMA